MHLNEAIQHLKESLADPTHKWGCEECKAEHEQLLVFLQELKKYRETFGNVKNTKFCIPECEEGCENLVEQYERENAELKRMLRLAVMDIGKMKSCEEFPLCVGCPKENELYCEWKHHDEAMELLGGTENAEN
jgi:hypothetical protein